MPAVAKWKVLMEKVRRGTLPNSYIQRQDYLEGGTLERGVVSYRARVPSCRQRNNYFLPTGKALEWHILDAFIYSLI